MRLTPGGEPTARDFRWKWKGIYRYMDYRSYRTFTTNGMRLKVVYHANSKSPKHAAAISILDASKKVVASFDYLSNESEKCKRNTEHNGYFSTNLFEPWLIKLPEGEYTVSIKTLDPTFSHGLDIDER